MSCNQQGCVSPAHVEYTWPTDGERKRSCALHGEKARQVCAALGFGLVVRPLICAVCAVVATDTPQGDPLPRPGDCCCLCGKIQAAPS
ncbi:MAG TPA: hypothetical protein VF405_00790 [Gammaproteobacteria bacterium]